MPSKSSARVLCRQRASSSTRRGTPREAGATGPATRGGPGGRLRGVANGTAIDPKEEAVYVLESTRNDCLRIAIKKDGTFGKPEVYAKNFPALPDGMAFDVESNLYVTLPAVVKDGKLAPAHQIIKVDTKGNWTMLIDDPAGQKLDFPTNCAFGGPGLQDLYFANLQGGHFSRWHTPLRGHPLYHQR